MEPIECFTEETKFVLIFFLFQFYTLTEIIRKRNYRPRAHAHSRVGEIKKKKNENSRVGVYHVNYAKKCISSFDCITRVKIMSSTHDRCFWISSPFWWYLDHAGCGYLGNGTGVKPVAASAQLSTDKVMPQRCDGRRTVYRHT